MGYLGGRWTSNHLTLLVGTVFLTYGYKYAIANHMEIKINDYYESDHFRVVCEDNYNISRTYEHEKNEMHHIHNISGAFLVEDGAADCYISGKKCHVEPRDILVIGAIEHHLRRIDRLLFSRHGFTVKPTYYRSITLGHDLQKVSSMPSPEVFVQNYKNVDRAVFGYLIDMLCHSKEESEAYKPFRIQIQWTIITQIVVLLFRAFRFKMKSQTWTCWVKNYFFTRQLSARISPSITDIT